MKCKICNAKLRLRYKNLYDNRHGYPGKFSIYRCINCGFMQTKPQLGFKQLSGVYSKYYLKRDADIKSVVERAKEIPSKVQIYLNGWETTCHFQTKKGQKVLDVGCGTCQSLLEIKKLGGEAWGIDPDRSSKKVADKLKLNFHLGTIHDCNFPKKYFDLITASQVIEHEGDPLKFLQDCKKFLRPDGRIILSFPNTGALMCYIWGENWLHWHIPYHLNLFNKKPFLLLTKQAGLHVSSLKTVTPNLWTLLQVRSYLNNVPEGKRDPMWDGGPGSVVNQKQSLRQKILRRLLPIIQSLLFINRLIDSLSLGESLVIVLKNNG